MSNLICTFVLVSLYLEADPAWQAGAVLENPQLVVSVYEIKFLKYRTLLTQLVFNAMISALVEFFVSLFLL